LFELQVCKLNAVANACTINVLQSCHHTRRTFLMARASLSRRYRHASLFIGTRRVCVFGSSVRGPFCISLFVWLGRHLGTAQLGTDIWALSLILGTDIWAPAFIPYLSSPIPYTLSLMPYPLSCIPYPLFLIPHTTELDRVIHSYLSQVTFGHCH
jgi:hypothetical protein